MWQQSIKPNLDDDKKHPLYIYVDGKICTNWVGWCLAVVKASYGATKSMGNAYNAWCQDKTQHKGYDIPENVYVPIWWDGGTNNYGHVAIAYRTGMNIKIWSSPYKKSDTFTIFEGNLYDNIDRITKTYGCKSFLGWTEYVCEKQVIKKKEEPKTETTPVAKEDNNEIIIEVKQEDDKKDNEVMDENNVTTESNAEYPAEYNDAINIISDAGKSIEIPQKVRVIAYFIGDFLAVSAFCIPDIANMIIASDLASKATSLSSMLYKLALGIFVAFKLSKPKVK